MQNGTAPTAHPTSGGAPKPRVRAQVAWLGRHRHHRRARLTVAAMNPAAILALISCFYGQVVTL